VRRAATCPLNFEVIVRDHRLLGSITGPDIGQRVSLSPFFYSFMGYVNLKPQWLRYNGCIMVAFPCPSGQWNVLSLYPLGLCKSLSKPTLDPSPELSGIGSVYGIAQY
jgi:hypothetical protein